jgi:glyoxylase-like metal-dependent hydrolase (beta-lactamase superfamily II)
MKLAEGVHRIEEPLGKRVLYLYLFTGDTILLFDTGVADTPARTVKPYLEGLGLGIDAITLALNSHCDADHFGGNAQLKELSPRTLLAAHAADRAQIEDPEVTMRVRYRQFAQDHDLDLSQEVQEALRAMMGRPQPLDLLLQGGETVRIGPNLSLQVLHAPGHSHGHIALYDPERRELYLGDAVLWKYIPNADGSPALAPTYLYPDSYLETINRFLELAPRVIHTSHYPPMEGEAAIKFLKESREFAEDLDHYILQLVRHSPEPLTLKEVIQAVFDHYGLWPEATRWDLAHPVSGHLNHLARRGLLEAVRKGGLVAWRSA